MEAFANTGALNIGALNIRVVSPKFLSAIALLGLLLSVSDTPRALQQTGKSIALLASGAIAATLIQKCDRQAEVDQLANELQVMHKYQEAEIRSLDTLKQQLLGELYTAALTEATLLEEVTQIAATSQEAREQSEARIAALEGKLAEKTAMATDMLTELESEATNTFGQFNAKIAAQDALINNLHRQIEGLRAENATLSASQTNGLLSKIGSGSLNHHQLLNQLVQN
ncbi:MAG: hypothetical protein AAFU53_16765 [Cyanobacteria bacterium J06632_3]